MVDFPTIAKAVLSHSEDICGHLFPLGVRRGREYVVGDLYGNRGESLSVNLHTGIWKDFSNSGANSAGGDLISLVAAAKNIGQREAAQFLKERYSISDDLSSQEKFSEKPSKIDDEFQAIFPVESPAPDEAFIHPSLGDPVAVFVYNDRQGRLINYVCRFDPKSYRALTYGRYRGREGWQWRQIPAPRSLYGLETLPESGRIIICEGEKATEYLKEQFPERCVMTWPSGAEAVNQTDWTPLFNKQYEILLWPDNDAPGHKAMQQVGKILHGKVKLIELLDVSSLPEKADAADWKGSVTELSDFLFEKRTVFTISAPKLETVNQSAKTGKLNDSAGGDIDPMKLPGLVGDTVRWIASISDQPRPDIAFLNTLAFAGAVFGRRYESPRRTRTNIYVVATGETGVGKNHPRQALTRLASTAGLLPYVGGNSIRSDTGMLRGLMNSGSQVLMLDEFGQFLKALHDPKMIHYRNIMRTFLTLYSDSNSVYNHGDYADPKAKTITIHQPNLCIYGTTTEAEYIPALRKSAIESGELNRFIVLPMDSSKKYPLRETPPQDIPESLVDQWRKFAPAFSKKIGEMVNNDTVLPTPYVIPWGECEEMKYKLECEKEDIRCSGLVTKALYGRLPENVIKVAMIMAIGKNPDNPILTPDDFSIGETIVRASITYMEELAQHHMAESEYEALVHEFLIFIKKHADGVDKSSITRRFQRVDTRKRDDILRTLEEQESIERTVEQLETQGRRKTLYKAL